MGSIFVRLECVIFVTGKSSLFGKALLFDPTASLMQLSEAKMLIRMRT